MMFNWIVMEIQHNANGTSAIVPPVGYEDRNAAEAKYHTVLAAAAVSTVKLHVCTLLDSEGRTIMSQAYPHEAKEGEE